MDKFKIVELTYPITKKDEKDNDVNINALKISRVKVKHLKLLPNSAMKKAKEREDGLEDKDIDINFADYVPLIASLANLEESEADEIDIDDLVKIVDVIGELLGEANIPQTGKK